MYSAIGIYQIIVFGEKKRLQEIYHICRHVKDSWNELEYDEVKGAGNITYYKVKNADAIRKTLADLESIELLHEGIQRFFYGCGDKAWCIP